MVKQPRPSDRKIQFPLNLVEWDVKLIKAIADISGRPQSEVARTALFTGLLTMAGGDVQSANELIEQWESFIREQDSAENTSDAKPE